ncbi:MAG: hypothetical protein LBR91_03085, partial [Puniceicoccales bacterium]|nr:hypothetical protein [Puniceicoccales bacterium]
LRFVILEILYYLFSQIFRIVHLALAYYIFKRPRQGELLYNSILVLGCFCSENLIALYANSLKVCHLGDNS